MPVLPLRNTVVTAASVLMKDICAAVYAEIDANSDWTIPQHAAVTAGAPGSFAMVLRNPSGSVELTVINNGSQAAPSATSVRLGINPDGDADPILDATNPAASAANFSGLDLGMLQTQTPQNVQFLLFEYADSITVLFPRAARTAHPNGWHWGTAWQQPITALADGAPLVALDGNIIYNNLPNTSTAGGNWAPNNFSNGLLSRRRIHFGQSVSNFLAGINAPWSEPGSGANRLGARVPTTVAAYQYGTHNVAWPIAYGNLSNNCADNGWVSKYLRIAPPSKPPNQFWYFGGQEQYMVIGTSTANSSLCIPVLPGFNPTP